MHIPSYDELTPSIPDISPEEVFTSVERLFPAAEHEAAAGGRAREVEGHTGDADRAAASSPLFACLWPMRGGDEAMEIAREFSPRIQQYGACVVLDIGGLGRLLGDASAIGAELDRAVAVRGAPLPHGMPIDRGMRISTAPSIRGTAGSEPVDSAGIGSYPRAGGEPAIRVAIAPTQVGSLLLSRASPALTVVTSHLAARLGDLPVHVLHQLLADLHGVAYLRPARRNAAPSASVVRGTRPSPVSGWPSWPACERAFDVLDRWGIRTLGELAALPAADLSARLGQDGIALQQLARGVDPRPLVPDPAVPRFVERMELEWPIETLEPLSFVLARLLDPLAAALERAGRGAAAIRLDLRLVDRTTHARVLQLPAAMRDARVLRTLVLLDLESHPPPAAIEVVTIELDPAPGRVIQYSLLDRPVPSAETVATLTARLGALVGDSRCGTPVVADTHRPDAFTMRRFAPDDRPAPRGSTAGRRTGLLRRFRPPIAIRVTVERGRPVRVGLDRRGMPGGRIAQAAGPWRTSGAWWDPTAAHWDRDEWDVAFTDAVVCRLFQERGSGRWFMEAVID